MALRDDGMKGRRLEQPPRLRLLRFVYACSSRKLLAVTVLAAVWHLMASRICQSCYRLGNYIDYYLQRELLQQALEAASSGADPSGPAAMTYGIWRGVRMRRMIWPTRWFQPITLIEHLQHHRMARLPASALARPNMARVMRSLTEGAALSARTHSNDFFLWWNHSHARTLLPYVGETLRNAISSAGSVPLARYGRPSDRTVVVHFRAGDFTRLMRWKPAQLRLCIAAMIVAARTFPDADRIDAFEVLGGGIDHRCDTRTDDCGASALGLVARGLRSAFPNATVRSLRGATVDEDFVRMVRAPMLLIGAVGYELVVGSSYAHYAAAASEGHVRSPACFLRFDTCMPGPPGGPRSMVPDVERGLARADSEWSGGARWHGYAHPSCKHCRELRAEPAWERIARVRDTLQ